MRERRHERCPLENDLSFRLVWSPRDSIGFFPSTVECQVSDYIYTCEQAYLASILMIQRSAPSGGSLAKEGLGEGGCCRGAGLETTIEGCGKRVWLS